MRDRDRGCMWLRGPYLLAPHSPLAHTLEDRGASGRERDLTARGLGITCI